MLRIGDVDGVRATVKTAHIMTHESVPVEHREVRQKLAMEMSLKRSELARQRLDFEVEKFRHEQMRGNSRGWRYLLTPTGVVIAGAAIGLLGTAAGKYADYLNTKQQQETTIIIKASDVPSGLEPHAQEVQRAKNLLWFSDARYIFLPNKFRDELRKIANVAPGATTAPPVFQSSSPYSGVQSGEDLVQTAEGYYEKPYKDPMGALTVGFGHTVSAAELEQGTINIDGRDVPFPNGLSKGDAARLLQQDMRPAYDAIRNLVKVSLNNNQRDALASFIRNSGVQKLKDSNILRSLNAGDYNAVPEELMRYDRVQGQQIRGLTLRRQAEAALWRKPVTELEK